MTDLARTTGKQHKQGRAGAVAARQTPTSYARLSVDGAHRERDRTTSIAALPDTTDRVASVDAVRGFAMFWIIAGDALAWAMHEISSGREGLGSAAARLLSVQLQHVPWEGFRFYDFLFPLFVFIIGVSIVFSLSRLTAQEGTWAAHGRVVRRSLLLFVLGLIYYGGASNLWPDIRLMGVLQRIALCYLFASLLFLHLDWRGLIVALVSLLVGYWALMTFVSVPGVGAGSFAIDANLTRWIDTQYLPGRRFYGEWDPEGLLSTLPAIGTCLLGVLAGLLLKERRIDPMRKTLWLIGAGLALVAAGYLWGIQFPVIKNIWTSSFVLVAGGFSLLLLGVFHLLIDVGGYKAWATVFLWIGANAIVIYMTNSIVGFETVARRLVGGDVARFFDTHVAQEAGTLVIVVVGLMLAVALARFLFYRKIFLRL